MLLRKFFSPSLSKRFVGQLYSQRSAHSSEDDDRDLLNVPKGIHLNLLNDPDEPHPHIYINKYSSEGFSLDNGLTLDGSVIFFPRSFLSWKVNNVSEVNEETLSLFKVIYPKLDILVIGTGLPKTKVSAEVIQFLRANKINFEILPTDKAISTFNFLSAEQRWVAAALIPPREIEDSLSRDIREHLAAQDLVARLEGEDDDDIPLLQNDDRKLVTQDQVPRLEGTDEDDILKYYEKPIKKKFVGKTMEHVFYEYLGTPKEGQTNIFGYRLDFEPMDDYTAIQKTEETQPIANQKSSVIRRMRKSDFNKKTIDGQSVVHVRSPLEMGPKLGSKTVEPGSDKVVSKTGKRTDKHMEENTKVADNNKTDDKQ